MDVSGTEQVLIQIHAAIALFTVPEMALTGDEAHDMAVALAAVEKHYPINPLSEKHMAVLGLFMCVTKVYGKRVPLILAGGKKQPVNPQQPTGQAPIRPVETVQTNPGPAVPSWFEAPPPTDHVQ